MPPIDFSSNSSTATPMNDLFRVAPELDSMISMASAQIVLDTAKDLGVAPRRVTEFKKRVFLSVKHMFHG